MWFITASPAKKASLGGAAAAAFLLLSAGQALAHGGEGEFSGYEIPPAHVTLAQGTICATFHADDNDPLIHQLDMEGDFHDINNGTGTATFTGTTVYHAGPGGTASSNSCNAPASVPGTMEIVFGKYVCTDDSATYQRTNTSVYTLTFSAGTCDDTTTAGDDMITTTVTFTGVQLLCPPADCSVHPDAATVMFGDYVQTG